MPIDPNGMLEAVNRGIADAEPNHSVYGKRFQSNDQKGEGWLGPLKRPDGQLMTEFTIGVPHEGKEIQVPTLVPTLDANEVKALLALQDGQPVPKSVVDKAVAHAKLRLSQGLSPFHDTPK